MKYLNITLVILLSFTLGCTGVLKKTGVKTKTAHPEGRFTLTDMSSGLPSDGLWRQNIVFYDVNNDGLSDIITPPPRKAEPKDKRPFIFVWDETTSGWKESEYKFPPVNGYDYGGIAVGDINNDGFFDIALANHNARIIILINDKNNSFTEMPFSPEKDFYSRTIEIADMNDDGWLDIIALSEPPFVKGYKPPGILVGLNLGGKDWDISFIENSDNIQGSTMRIGDYNNDGEKDIALAPLTMKAEDIKLLFFGKNRQYEEFFNGSRLLGNNLSFICSSGDYDGDGIEELGYLLSGASPGTGMPVKAYKWKNDMLVDMSNGLTVDRRPLVLTSNDFDFDGKDELLLLSKAGLHIFKYYDNNWKEVFFREMDYEYDIKGVYGITSTVWLDSSYLIVYNRGRANSDIHGIRGLILKWQKD